MKVIKKLILLVLVIATGVSVALVAKEPTVQQQVVTKTIKYDEIPK